MPTDIPHFSAETPSAFAPLREWRIFRYETSALSPEHPKVQEALSEVRKALAKPQVSE